MRITSIIIVLLSICVLFAQQNPFRRPTQDSTKQQLVEKKTSSTATFKKKMWNKLPFAGSILALQRDLTQKLSGFFRSIKEEATFGKIVGLLFVAFLYGVIHSLGPGHAKILFISHEVTHKTKIRDTWFAGGIFSFTHIITSVLLFFIMRMLLGIGQSTIERFSHRMLNVSGFLIIAAGILILCSSFIEKIAETYTKRFLREVSSLKGIAMIAGLAPCPGAFLILVFSNISGILPLGILAVVTLSMGMAVTVSSVGTLGGVVGMGLSSKKQLTVMKILQRTLKIAGGIAIVGIGALMAFQ